MIRRKNPDGSVSLIADEAMQSKFRIEWWFSQRIADAIGIKLQNLEARVCAGATTFEVRRDRIAEILIEHKLADKKCGKKNGTAETFAGFFERLYGRPLTQEISP